MTAQIDQHHIIAVLTETSLPIVLWLILAGKKPLLLATHAHIRYFQRPLEKLAQRFLRQGYLGNARDTFDSVDRIFEMPNYACLSDIFQKIEPWVNTRHDFEKWDRSKSPYSGPVQQSAWLVTDKFCNIVLAIACLRREDDWSAYRFVGLSREIIGICSAYCGDAPSSDQPRVRVPIWPVNLAIIASLMIYSVIWALMRTRLRVGEPKKYLLGATLALDPRLFQNLDDIVGDRKRTAILCARPNMKATAAAVADADGIDFLHIYAGLIGPAQAFVWIARSIIDYLSLGRRVINMHPAVALISAKLVHARLAYRAFFNCYRFDYILGRDDHDNLHQIRSQELRRHGGVSLGINHGIPVTDILEPGWRYIDFDIYYTFGRTLYERHYADTWPTHMKVVPIGTFGLSRSQLHTLRVPRTKDVVVFANPTLDNDRLVQTGIRLAEFFQDRRVFFKSKPAPKDHFFRDLLDGRDLPENFVYSAGGLEETYDFLSWCGYSISTISTLGAETVHVGLRTFILDTQPADYPFFYREFDGLTFHQPDEVITRIVDLESGKATYPWQAYDGLADASGQDPFDRIRADMGLPPLSADGRIPALVAVRTQPLDSTDTFRPVAEKMIVK